MNQNETTAKNGRRWLVTGIAAGVVVLILAALLIIDFATSAGRQQAAPPATSGPATVHAAGITVGSGGTKTGADGVTKIGYAGTCDGAVQAATNYKKALTDIYRVSDEKKIALIQQVVLPGTTRESLIDDATKRIAGQKTPEGKQALVGYTLTTHVEWGGSYKITDCTPERAAVVEILSCTFETVDPSLPKKSYTNCDTDTVRLVWSIGDWKVISLHEDPPGDTLNVTANIAGWEPSPEKLPMPAAIRDAYLLNSATGSKDEGWVDYAGISRK